MSTAPQGNIKPTPPPPFRVDVQLHDLLVSDKRKATSLPIPSPEPQVLPEPVFPQHPELLDDSDFDYESEIQHALKGRRKWTRPMVLRAMNGWLFPYVKSRVLPGDFHPHHLVPFHRVEMQSRLPLLLGV